MKKLCMAVTITAAILFWAAVFTCADNAPASENKTAGTIEVAAGRDFVITLASNATTGYRWQLAGELDGKVIALKASRYEPTRTDRVGAPGREVWTFTAVASGRAAISFEYVRPWEKGIPPVKTERYDIIVK